MKEIQKLKEKSKDFECCLEVIEEIEKIYTKNIDDIIDYITTIQINGLSKNDVKYVIKKLQELK